MWMSTIRLLKGSQSSSLRVRDFLVVLCLNCLVEEEEEEASIDMVCVSIKPCLYCKIRCFLEDIKAKLER